MPIPLINHHLDRTPGFRPGDRVAYWQWHVDPKTGRRDGTCSEPLDNQGRFKFRGIVELFHKETSLPDHRGGNHEHAEDGELIIRLLSPDTGLPTAHFERVHHIPPMHSQEWRNKFLTHSAAQPAAHLDEPEPQRWFLVGVDPMAEEKPGAILYERR